MRTIKRNILKSFLFSGLGLTIATITFAGIVRVFNVPGSPGRPSFYDIEADWAGLMFKKPMSDGGSRIDLYLVEYRDCTNGRWYLDMKVIPRNSNSDVEHCTVTNRVGSKPVSYRVSARNAAGYGRPSLESAEIIFRDPDKK